MSFNIRILVRFQFNGTQSLGIHIFLIHLLANAIARVDCLEFLADVVPRKLKNKPTSKNDTISHKYSGTDEKQQAHISESHNTEKQSQAEKGDTQQQKSNPSHPAMEMDQISEVDSSLDNH